MYIKQIYTNCLSQASYYIESGDECVIIDPLRDIDLYTSLIKKRDKTLKYVLETHFHADFISGHLELSNKYSCPIIYGPNANTKYNSISLKDGDVLGIGKMKIKIIHTPGHTLESVCYLLLDEKNNQHSVYTGDTLFIGDVGRPDLAIDNTLTEKALCKMLYNSLYNKIMKLDDNILVYPAHGKGTQCGKNLSSDTFSTLGNQKMNNYALKYNNIDDFTNAILSDLPLSPDYFKDTAYKNKYGYLLKSELFNKSLIALDKNIFLRYYKDDYFVLDTRSSKSFSKMHLKGSTNISLNGRYAISAANLIDVKSNLLIISDIGFEEESIVRLNRVGFDNIVGFLSGGINSFKNEKNLIDSVEETSGKDFHLLDDYEIIDVRDKNEFDNLHVQGAKNYPLFDIINNTSKFKKNKKYVIHCLTGYRSSIASSLLKQHDIKNIINVNDGFKVISKNTKVILQ